MLQLIVPGFGRPWPDGIERPATESLDLLLARSDRLAGGVGYAEILFDLFKVPEASRVTTPFCWKALTGEAPKRWVMHADPVHLRADRDRLLLFDLPAGVVPPQEARHFAGAFNEHFSADGLTLHILAPAYWFIALDARPGARFTPLDRALDMPLDEAMPTGPEADRWRQLMNEVQMLFFQLPVNREREERGQLTVNGLWFSEPGRVMESPKVAPRLLSAVEDPLLQGLMECSEKGDTDDQLLVFDTLERAFNQQDSRALVTAMQRLDTQVGTLLQQKLELRLQDCNGTGWHWKPAMKWRFWRRVRPLA